MFKKGFALLGTLALVLTLASCGGKSEEQLMEEGWVKNPAENGWVKNPEDNGWLQLKELPAARDLNKKDKTGQACTVGNYTLECTGIDQKNLGDYMNRPDVVYIDLRGIDNGYLGEHINGFEPVEYFNFICGDTYQLFAKDFTPRYEESIGYLNLYFPKDKTLFLMCQSGGRVVSMMQLLEANGYDMSKIYNVGGFNQLGDKDSSVYKYAVRTGLEKVTVDYTATFSNLTKIEK
ncbi:MAG: rhodanese-like domain-containing protein [Bacilli bacterium]|nr:rhodanese-like domain-containing protein [Bacilli bacterium]